MRSSTSQTPMGSPPLVPSVTMAISEKDLELKIPGNDDEVGHNEGEITELDPVQERRVLSKFDMFVMPYMALLVLFGYLDRTNIGNCSDFQMLRVCLTDVNRKCTCIWL